MKLLNVIKDLIQLLPEKDVQLGSSFYDKRDFQSLLDLTDSAIVKVKKDSKKYEDIDIRNLIQLKNLLEEYIDFL